MRAQAEKVTPYSVKLSAEEIRAVGLAAAALKISRHAFMRETLLRRAAVVNKRNGA
jgi:hypothetical protein